MGRNGSGVKIASASSIAITFSYQGVECRERLKLEPTPANLKKAARHKAAIEAAIEAGTFDYATTFPGSKRAALFAPEKDSTTVESFLDTWLISQERQLKTSTYCDYRKTVLNFLTPEFGKLPLSQLKRPLIRAWCEKLDCSNKRIANLLSPLRIALDRAVEDELIDSNPISGWTYKNKDGVKTEDDIDPFSIDEQSAILRQLSAQGQNLIQFAFWSGLRTSELVALEWNDIDWIRNVVRVTKAETQVSAAPETPKTKSGRREVKLLPPALSALTQQKSFSYFHESGRIFLNPRTNEPWDGDAPIRKTLWTHALKRAGVRYRRPYQTRHTYASMMLSAGESPMWVAQQMGHRDWTMIARVYGKWIPDAQPDAGAKAVATFSRSIPGSGMEPSNATIKKAERA